jgi:hypothetical protein
MKGFIIEWMFKSNGKFIYNRLRQNSPNPRTLKKIGFWQLSLVTNQKQNSKFINSYMLRNIHVLLITIKIFSLKLIGMKSKMLIETKHQIALESKFYRC